MRVEETKAWRYAERVILALVGLASLAVSLVLFAITATAAISGVVDKGEHGQLMWAIPCVIGSGFLVVWSSRLVLGKPRKDGGLISRRFVLWFARATAALPVLVVLSGTNRSPVAVFSAVLGLVSLTLQAINALARLGRGADGEPRG